MSLAQRVITRYRDLLDVDWSTFTTSLMVPRWNSFSGRFEGYILPPPGMDNPMQARGDLIHNNGRSSATRLPIGTVGQVLTVVAGDVAWAAPAPASDSTFPASPTAGQEFKRSDQGGAVYRWDGARWLSVEQQSISLSVYTNVNPASGASVYPLLTAIQSSAPAFWVDEVDLSFFVLGVNDPDNHWIIHLFAAGGSATTDPLEGAPMDTTTDRFGNPVGPNVWAAYAVTSTINPLAGASYQVLYIRADQFGSPGPLYSAGTLLGRRVG